MSRAPAHAADGYARASGKVGVAIATSGPGATNLVTGIATAMMDSVPLVASPARFPPSCWAPMRFKKSTLPALPCRSPSTTTSSRATQDIAKVLREAFLIARSGRPGPVLVDITKDAQQGLADFDFAAAAPSPHRPHPMLSAGQDALDEALKLILSAKRPIILAGNGILKSNAMDQIRTLAERLQIPVASTLLGLGAFPPRTTSRLA